jgi:glycosyltransferase involved in cell wall biosynthesis
VFKDYLFVRNRIFIDMEINVSIIIPCKNEQGYIGKLLDSLEKQHLSQSFEIIIADAKSTDLTLDIINSYYIKLPNLRVIEGGLPSVGRNLGAQAANGHTLLFIDADAYFKDDMIIRHSVRKFNKNKLELLGCYLNIEHNWFVKLIYFFCNIIVNLSKFDKPFVVGTYFMIKKDKFFELGGFDESLMHCEDYFLSKEVSSKKFSLFDGYVYTDDRRFKKMGRFKIIKYFILNILNRNNKNYFKKDIGYWK